MTSFLFLALLVSYQDWCPDCGKSPDVDPPVVSLRVLAPQKSTDTGLITYRVIATNRSNAKAFDVKVKLDLPEKTTFHAGAPQPDKQQNTLVWNIGTMPGKCQRQFEVILKTEADSAIEACFRISYEHGVCVTTSTACKPPGKPETLPVPKTAGSLSLTKIGPARQGMGTPILYSMTVTNSGKIPLREVELEDVFPANSVYVAGSADNQGQLQGPESKKMLWRLGNMLPGETRTVTFKVRPNQVGTFLNVAHARGMDPDGLKVQSPEAYATTEVSGMATLYMEVKDLQDPVFVGGSTMYTILVRNTGSASAGNIRLQAEIPPGLAVTRILPDNESAASGFRPGEARVNFAAFNLEPKQEKLFQIEVKAEREALFRFRTFLTSDVLDPARGGLVEDETTTVVNEKPVDSQTQLQPPGKMDQLARQTAK